MGMTPFEAFWANYPKRLGSNPRMPAEKKFATACSKGADPGHIVSSARKYADESREQGLLNTPYICMAQTWLNQQRWLDYAPDSGENSAKVDEAMAKRGYKWNGERWEKVETTSSNVECSP